MSEQQGIQVFLDPLTWSWLQISFYAFSFAIIGLIVAVAWHLISEFRTPSESKGIRNASHRRRAGAILAGDEGLAEWKIADRIGNEGYMVTKPEGKVKFHFTGLFPRRGKVPNDISVHEPYNLDKTRELAAYINELNTRKLFFKGARIPVWFGVKSKSVLASIYAIAAVQMTDQLKLAFDEAVTKAGLASDYFPIDLTALKEMVVKTSYNQSQLNAIESDSEHIGEDRVKKAELNKLVLLAGIAFGALGIIGGLIIAMIA